MSQTLVNVNQTIQRGEKNPSGTKKGNGRKKKETKTPSSIAQVNQKTESKSKRQIKIDFIVEWVDVLSMDSKHKLLKLCQKFGKVTNAKGGSKFIMDRFSDEGIVAVHDFITNYLYEGDIKMLKKWVDYCEKKFGF